MSKASPSPPPPARVAQSNSGRFVEYDQFIEEQLGKTRSHVRGVDITGGLMTLAAGTLAFFLAATVFDHWLIPGGLGFWGRWLLAGILLIGAGYYLVVELLPLCLRRINPIYAAHTIERGTPSLKNGLVNFLLLRSQRAALSEPVYRAIEEQAATGLARVPLDTAVDRSRLIKLGYVLVGLLAAAACYKVFSPKDPLATIGRVVLPWADIQPPTRVHIAEVEPGTTEAFRGQRLEVSAAVRGMAADGEVHLVYNTVDGQSVNQRIRMTVPADSIRYACALPDNSAGLQQDLDYHIEAGDARSKTYRVTVVAAPTIVVQSVDYVYPDYTGLAPQHVEQQPDLKGIEGTRVTLHALANQEIRSGAVDFNCDGREDKQLSIDGTHATVTFTLQRSEDRRGPEYASYQLRFRNATNQENPQPIAHRIEVTPDLPPDIEFLAPKSLELDVPARASVGLEIAANDPDFALRRVRLMAKVGDKSIADRLLLDEPREGQFTKKLWFGTGSTGLKPGDVVEYWAVAEDIKSPLPNRVETRHRHLRIVSPKQQKPQDDQLANRDDEIRPESSGKSERNNDPADDSKSQNAGKPEQQNAGEQGKGANEPDQRNGQDPKDGQTRPDNPRDSGQRPANEPSDAKQPAGQKSQKQDGDKQDGDKQEGGNQGGDKQDGDKQKSGEPQAGDGPGKPGGEKQDGQKGNQGDDQQGSVPSDGSDDGSAIEKILQNRLKNGRDGSASGDTQQEPGEGQQPQGDSKEPKEGQSKNEEGNSKSPGAGQQSGAGKKDAEAGKKDAGDNQKKGAGDGQQNQSQQPGNEKGQKPGDTGDKPGAAAGQPDNAQNQNQPGGLGGKNEPAAGNDTKPADKSEPGSAPGRQQRRPGGGGSDEKPQPQQGDEQLPGDGHSQPTNDRSGPAQRGGPADKGSQQKGERAPAKPDEPKAGKADNPKDGESGDAKRPDGQQKPDQQRKPQPGERTARNERAPGEKADPAKAGHKPGDPSAAKDEATKTNNPNDDGKQPGSGVGKGGQSNGDTGNKPQKAPPDSEQKPESKGGDGDDQKGQSGAGKSSDQNKQGSPQAQGNNQQRDKTQQGGGRNAMQPNDSAQSPSNSDRQSDSQSDSSGDRSGGGAGGGGQKANKQGKGSAGQNSSADEGAGKSNEPGDGETGDKAGDQKQGDGETGKAGSQRGNGSSSRKNPLQSSGSGKPPGEGGDDSPPGSDAQPDKQPPGDAAQDGKPSGEKRPPEGAQQKPAKQPGEKSPSKPPGSKETKPGQPAQQPQGAGGQSDEQAGQAGEHAGKPGGAGAGQPQGGGNAGQQTPPGAQEDITTPADDPNLEYARKATDLALEHLRDQMKRGEPDQELMDKLGWNRQDLEKFMSRWDKMRRQAKQAGPQGKTARKELDEALRSLGLRPRSTKLQASKGRDDQTQGMKESRRSQPPPEYAEQFKAYTQGTSRGGK